MFKPLIIAHRGASAHAPENTMSAFKKAAEAGADGIELDIQLSADETVVCIHDYSVDRTSNGKGQVNDMTLEELRKLDFGSWFSKTYEAEKIPTLDEVLAYTSDNTMLVNIEIKGNYTGIEKKTVELIEKHNMAGRVILSSFNHNSLIKVKKLAPQLPTGLLFSAGKVAKPGYVKTLRADAIHPWYGDMDMETSELYRQKGIKVNVYTVDKAEDIERMADIGVTSIITNVPESTRKLLY